MPFEPVSPLGGFTGTAAAPGREPVPSADDSVWGAAFRTENVVGSSIASEEVRTAREQVGALGGPVRIDPDFDPWAEIVDTPYESYTDQFAKAGNKDHFEAIKADIDRETKDRETIRKSGLTGIGASMAAGVLDLPILLPGGNIIRSAKGGVSLLRTAGSTAAYGTLAAAASESALHGSQQLRTGEESAVVIGGSTVLAGLLGAGIGKLFSRADQAAHAARIEQDFYVPGRGEPDPFTPGSVQVGAAPGASAKAASVADIIRQTAEEILPPGVRVQVSDGINLPKADATSDDGMFSLRGFYSPAIRAAEGISQAKGTGEQFWKQITKVGGVKKDELDWMGLEEFLKDKPSVTKAEVLDYMRAHQVELDEKVLGRGVGAESEVARQEVPTSEFVYDDAVKAEHLTLSGDPSGNFVWIVELPNNEFRLKFRGEKSNPGAAPIKASSRAEAEHIAVGLLKKEAGADARFGDYKVPGGENYRELLIRMPELEGKYESKHFIDQEIVHLRVDDRVGPNGQKVLFINEVQSDLHQTARPFGYGPEGHAAALEGRTFELPEKDKAELEALIAKSKKLEQDFDKKYADDLDGKSPERDAEWAEIKATDKRITELTDRQDKVRGQALRYLDAFGATGAPKAPMEGELWLELALKRALLYASENGYDAVSWARSDQIAKAVGAQPEDLALQYDSKIGKFLDKYTKKWGGKVEEASVIETRSFDGTEGNRRDLRQLDTQISANERALSREGLADSARAQIQTQLGLLREQRAELVGKDGEGVNPILRITPEMRASVMAGQPLSVRQDAEGLTAEGRFDPDQLLITISAAALDPVKTLKHETIHALRTMKLFTDAEWGTLEAAARSQGWVESNNVRALYEGIYSGRIDGGQYGLRAGDKSTSSLPSEPRTPTEVKVYHGTPEGGFDKFKSGQNPNSYQDEIWFTTDPDVADGYTGSGLMDLMPGHVRPTIYQSVIETNGFKELDLGGAHFNDWEGPTGKGVNGEIALAKSEGYPGLIIRNIEDISGGQNQYVTWTKGTVRSALSDNQLFSVRGEGKASTGPIDPKLENLLIEEAIAEQFSLWRNGAITVNGTVAKLFQRMKDFLDRVGNALRGQGFRNADDVFASVRGGDVAARATSAGRSIPAGAPLAAGSGRAASVGAAARETVDNTLKPALGLETVRIDPLIYLQNSKSDKTKAYIQELAETPLAYKKNADGFETAPLGSEMGEPGAVESRIKGWQAPLAEGVRTLENAFMRYRKGRDKIIGDQLRLTIGDAISKPEKLTWRQFKEEVAKAARRGDEHEIPEVAQAAKFARQNVFDPLKDRAIAKELLPEDISVETAESYLNRLYNKEKIIARRPEFKEIVTKWLDEAEAKNMAVSDRLRASLTQFDKTEEFIAKTEAKIATLTKQERDVSLRREEASRFNQFAFKRSQKLSEPLDEARAKIVEISAQIEEQVHQIDTVTEALRAEKADHPYLKSLEKQMFNVAHTVSKIKKATELFEVVDLAKEIDDSVTSFVDDMASASASFREGIKAYKAGPGKVVADMEKLRTKLRRKIAPYLKEIAANKKIIAEEEKAKLAGARGGAVFETAARKRVNTLADRQSGKSSELSNMELRLERHNTNLDALRAEIEEELGRYQGKSARDAVKALEARAKAEDLRLAKAQEEGKEAPVNRLRGADGPVLSAARKIAARVPKEPGETASLADEIIDRILGTPDGRLPYDAHLNHTVDSVGVSSSARGPLAAREFMIPDEMIEDFLENDFEQLMHAYVRTMAPDVELHARFDDVDMKRQFKEIQDDWARKAAAATSEKERRSLHAQRDGDIRRLAAIRDRLRGTYALPSNPDGLMLRTGRVMRSVNYMSMLGGQAISAIPDMGSIVFSHGITRTFGDGIIPLFRNFSGTRLAAREVKLAGTALDMVLDSRAMNIGEIMDDYGRHSKFERGVQSMARSFGTVSLMSPWNAAMKQTAGLITITRIIRASDALARGKIKKPDLERLAASGISQGNAIKIAEQFKKHGTKEGGVWLPNTENWDKEARAAKEAFRVALVREVDKTIITPGQEKFLWMSTELGKSLGQFKSFSVSANQRLLISGLQQRDMGTLSGAALMVALGGLVHILKTKAGGREPDIDWSDNEKTSQFMVNAVDRSGLLGWLMEANAISEKVTGGKVGLSALTGRPISRYASRNLVGAMAGPTFGTLQSIGQVSSAGFTEWKETDTRAARRLIPYQNLLYMRHLFDQVEAGTNEFFGVPMKATRH